MAIVARQSGPLRTTSRQGFSVLKSTTAQSVPVVAAMASRPAWWRGAATGQQSFGSLAR